MNLDEIMNFVMSKDVKQDDSEARNKIIKNIQNLKQTLSKQKATRQSSVTNNDSSKIEHEEICKRSKTKVRSPSAARPMNNSPLPTEKECYELDDWLYQECQGGTYDLIGMPKIVQISLEAVNKMVESIERSAFTEDDGSIHPGSLLIREDVEDMNKDKLIGAVWSEANNSSEERTWTPGGT